MELSKNKVNAIIFTICSIILVQFLITTGKVTTELYPIGFFFGSLAMIIARDK